MLCGFRDGCAEDRLEARLPIARARLRRTNLPVLVGRLPVDPDVVSFRVLEGFYAVPRVLGDTGRNQLAESLEKALDDLLFHFDQRDLAVELPAQARDAELFDTAGCDAIEPGKVGLHVQGEAVGGDPT